MIVSEITLLRERFVLYDTENPEKRNEAPSNRIQFVVERKDGPTTYVVRSKTMHSCIRLAARLLGSFSHDAEGHLFQTRQDWYAAWEYINHKYERDFNPENWCALYVEGDTLFHVGERSPLLDVIENLNIRRTGTYQECISAAQTAFKTDKEASIEYLSNVAWNASFKQDKARFHTQIRGPEGIKTFSFSVSGKPQEKFELSALNMMHCMYASASFLEGFQLAFLVNRLDKQARIHEEDDQTQEILSPEDLAHNKLYRRKTLERLGTLNREIRKLEQNYTVNYRPERPNFFEMIEEDQVII